MFKSKKGKNMTTLKTRNLSHALHLDKMTGENALVIKALETGSKTAYQIADDSGVFITNIRRSCSDLLKAGVIEPDTAFVYKKGTTEIKGAIENVKTNRANTIFKLCSEMRLL
jgi:hypothetical protein